MIKPDTMARRVLGPFGGVADPDNVARAHGVAVARLDLPGGAAGMLVHDDGGWVIILNSRLRMPRGRERFTLAHELGHYFCHRHLRRRFLCVPERPVDPLDRQANVFAAELLMPRPLAHKVIQSVLAAGGGVADAVEVLAATFAVSRAAAEIRLEELGYRLTG